jgi:hypothetical protein
MPEPSAAVELIVCALAISLAMVWVSPAREKARLV